MNGEQIRQMARRQHQQLESQRLALIRALESGAASARDRFDNKLVPGALVVWTPPIGPVWELVEVKVPPAGATAPGIVELVLQCRIPALLQANVPNQGFIVVGHQAEPGHATLSSPRAAQGPAEGERSSDQPPIESGASGLVDASGQALTDTNDETGAQGTLVTGDFGGDKGGGDGGSGTTQ